MNKKDGLDRQVMAGLSPLSRRGFLRAGALLGTTAASGLWGIRDVMAAEDIPEVPSNIQYLTLLEYRVMDKLRRIMLNPEVINLPTTVEIPVMENIDKMVGHLSKPVRDNVNLAGRIFEYSPGYKLTRFSAMDDDEALAYMEKWQNGVFFQRGLITSLKAVVALGYWRDSRTHAYQEYDGPVTERWGVRKLGNAPLPTDI